MALFLCCTLLCGLSYAQDNIDTSSWNSDDTNSDTSAAIGSFDQMDDDEQEAFLKQTDYEIYTKFYSGASHSSIGRRFIGIGAGVSGGGLLLVAVGMTIWINEPNLSYALVDIGCIIILVGQSPILVGIPLLAIGGAKKRHAQNDYRNKYSGTSSHVPSLRLNLHGNGIGLAIAF
jgi:hypothetical protein